MTAVPPRTGSLRRLHKRAQFLNAAKGRRAGRTGFSLQSIDVPADQPGIGFTVTKKVGNAPQRNRIKRRLRAAVTACKSSPNMTTYWSVAARRWLCRSKRSSPTFLPP
jgi:ribonuclease P protein component